MAGPLDSVYEEAGRAWNVDPGLIQAIHSGESGFNDGATSPKGAIGRGQFMPDTARGLGITNPRDPVQAIFGTAKLMSQHLDAANNDVPTALRLYQGGPNRAGWGPQNAAYPGYIMGKYQQVAARRPAADPAAAGRDAVIGDAVGRARQSGVAAPGHDASDADLLGALTAGASSAPASAATGTSSAPSATVPGDMPSVSDADLLRSLTAGATPPPDPKVAQAANAEADAIAAQYSGGTGMGGSNPDVQMPGVQFAKDAAGGAGRVLSSMGGATAAGFGSSPLGLDDNQRGMLQRIGMIPPAGARGNMLQNVNEAVINPLAATADLAGRGIRALVGGAQAGVAQAGAEVGQPQLGRDLAALPEAFPFGFNRGVPTPPNRLMAVRSEAPPIPASAAMDMADGGIPRAFIGGPVSAVPEGGALAAPLGAVTSQPLAAPANRLAPPAAGQPGSMGAAANPGGINSMTLREAAAFQATGEMQRLMQPAATGLDKTQYVPGVVPTAAEVAGNSTVSQAQKVLRQTPGNDAPFTARDAANNEARTVHFQGFAGTPTIVNTLRETRDAQASRDLAAAWQAKAPVDAAPVVQQIDALLAGPQGKIDPVRAALTKARGSLIDGKGDLETDPEMLYGARRNIATMLGKAAQQETPTLREAAGALTEVKNALDGTIEKGAPGYQQYLQNFSQASRPIDTMELLQDYGPGLTNSATRNMTFGKVDSMMRDIVTSRQSPGVNPAKSIPDDVMEGLWNLHSDLKRANNVALGKPAGSDSNMLWQGTRALGLTAAHAAAGYVAPFGVGNMLVQGASQAMARAKAAKQVNRLLDGSGYTPP